MRKYFAILVLAVTFVFVAYMESPTDTVGFESAFNGAVPDSEVDEMEVMGQQEESARSFYGYVQEDIDMENGDVIETYREYEFLERKDGTIAERIPTENYNYLRYKQEME